ncbi:hypothetical protein LXL04_000536 [Taraxacum kok-saghyz]
MRDNGRNKHAAEGLSGVQGEVALTSFYVYNLPGDAHTQEIRDRCKQVGNLVDIYLAGRRNNAGSFFAFFKFSNVDNENAVETALNEVVIRGRKIHANRAKHPRRSFRDKPNTGHATKTRESIQAVRQVYKVKDHRTFAEATKGANTYNPPLLLNSIKEVQKWSSNAVLVGEVKSFDMFHL